MSTSSRGFLLHKLRRKDKVLRKNTRKNLLFCLILVKHFEGNISAINPLIQVYIPIVYTFLLNETKDAIFQYNFLSSYRNTGKIINFSVDESITSVL